MQSSLIGKIEKARRYTGEPERIKIAEFSASFQGDNNLYQIRYEAGKWHCTCRFFLQMGICSHTMALQKIMEPMLPTEAMSLTYSNIPVEPVH